MGQFDGRHFTSRHEWEDANDGMEEEEGSSQYMSAKGNWYTVLRCTLEGTGRRHQIRRHCAEILGMPLLGDTDYGGSAEKIKRQALHAWEVSIGDHLIRCPLPPDFKHVLLTLFGVQESFFIR